MTVERQELEELQMYIQRQIRRLSSAEDIDHSSVFELQSTDSNISLILSYADMQDTNMIILGTKDKKVRDLLMEFRKESFLKDDADQFITELCFQALEALHNIQAGMSLNKNCDNDVLRKNIEKTFSKAEDYLEQIASLKDNYKKLSRWSNIPLDEEESIKPVHNVRKTVSKTTTVVRSTTKTPLKKTGTRK